MPVARRTDSLRVGLVATRWRTSLAVIAGTRRCRRNCTTPRRAHRGICALLGLSCRRRASSLLLASLAVRLFGSAPCLVLLRALLALALLFLAPTLFLFLLLGGSLGRRLSLGLVSRSATSSALFAPLCALGFARCTSGLVVVLCRLSIVLTAHGCGPCGDETVNAFEETADDLLGGRLGRGRSRRLLHFHGIKTHLARLAAMWAPARAAFRIGAPLGVEERGFATCRDVEVLVPPVAAHDGRVARVDRAVRAVGVAVRVATHRAPLRRVVLFGTCCFVFGPRRARGRAAASLARARWHCGDLAARWR